MADQAQLAVDLGDSEDSNPPYEPQPKLAEEITDLPEVNLTTTQRPLCADLPSGDDSAHKEVVKPYKGKGKGKRTKKPGEEPASSETVTKKPTIIHTNKLFRPEEEIKLMNIKIHPVLWKQKYMCEVGQQVDAAGARVVVDSTICHPALVMWSRRLPLNNNGGQKKLLPTEEWCARALYIIPAEEIGDLLTTHLLNIRELCDCDITVVVYRDTSKDRRAVMTELEVEIATVGTLTDLLTTAGCDSSIVNSPTELAALIVRFTKTLAEARFKKVNNIADKLAEFSMHEDDMNIHDDDNDVASNTSQQMSEQKLVVVSTSTPEISRVDVQLPDVVQDAENITTSPTGSHSLEYRLKLIFFKKLFEPLTPEDEDTLI